MADEILIKAENLSKKFCRNLKRSLWYGLKDITEEIVGQNSQKTILRKDEFWALKDISFQVRRGECLGLIGRNGAGKSTILKMINGLIKPDRGSVTVRGNVGALISLGAGFNPILTGLENIYNNAAVLGISKSEVDKKLDKIIQFSELSDFIHTPVQHYSSGMQVRLGFAIAAQLEPDVLLIDEVLAVGDLGFKLKCLNAVNKLLKNAAVIFVTHTMQFISRICTNVMVLNFGKEEYYGKDVSGGIDSYYSLFDSPTKKTIENGKAAIFDMKISNGKKSTDKKNVLSVSYGDDLQLQFRLSIDDSIKDTAIKIFFLNQELQPVADCFSKHCNFQINQNCSTINVKVKFSNIQFNSGIYFISISVIDPSDNDSILSRNDFIASFRVKQSYRSWSPMLISADWEQY